MVDTPTWACLRFSSRPNPKLVKIRYGERGWISRLRVHRVAVELPRVHSVPRGMHQSGGFVNDLTAAPSRDFTEFAGH